MLVTRKKGGNALNQIAEGLLHNLFSFGQLSIEELTEERLTRYLQLGGGVIPLLLKILEKHIGIGFSSRSIPFCFNTNSAEWSSILPLAGYSGSSDGPTPSQIATTYILNWNVSVRSGNTTPRLFTSALWICHHQDLSQAISFLFDLQKNGFIPNISDIEETTLILLTARSNAGSDQEMVSKFFRGEIPDSPNEWLSYKHSTEWITNEELSDLAEEILFLLVARTSLEIEEVKDSFSWDDWLIGQSILNAKLSSFIRIFQRADLSSNRIETLLAKLEVVRADAAGLTETLHLQNAFLPLKSNFETARESFFKIRSNAGDNGKNQFFKESILVPSMLREKVLDLDIELPEGWRQISWQIAIPYSVRFGYPLPFPNRSYLFDADVFLESRLVQDFFNEYGIEGRNQQVLVIQKEYHGVRIKRDTIPEFPKYPQDKFQKIMVQVHSAASRNEIGSLIQNSDHS